MKPTTLNKKIFLTGALVFALQAFAFSQPPTNPQSGDPDVPITGIEILIGAGALIGARKLVRLRHKN